MKLSMSGVIKSEILLFCDCPLVCPERVRKAIALAKTSLSPIFGWRVGTALNFLSFSISLIIFVIDHPGPTSRK